MLKKPTSLKVFQTLLTLTLSAVVLTGLVRCTSKPTKEAGLQQFREMQIPDAISIMSYNIENLFDNQDDPQKADDEYLPLAQKSAPEHKKFCNTQTFSESCLNLDWSDAIIDKKMRHTADSILQIRGRGPDILVLIEVENLSILKKLNSKYLKAANYQTVELLEGDDPRGIDIGILSRFPLAGKSQLHRLQFTEPSKLPDGSYPKTRGILEVPLKLPDGQTLYVLGLHFPSQRNPTPQRHDAVNTLNQILRSKKPGSLVIAAGDFNISKEEDESHGLFQKTLAEDWLISHQIGCKSCLGTHNYKNEWSFLDAILFSKTGFSQGATHHIADASIQTPQGGKYQMLRNGKPARFKPESDIGVTDHLPIYAEIFPKKSLPTDP